MNNTHPRSQASSWSIENSPFRVRAMLRLMFHLCKKTPCLCGGVYSALIQMGLPHENPHRIYACRNTGGCLRVYFSHCTFICIPGRVLAFHQHRFSVLIPARFPSCCVCCWFESEVLSIISGQLMEVGEAEHSKNICKYCNLTNVNL